MTNKIRKTSEVPKQPRPEESKISRAELQVFIDRTARLISKHPDKAATILTEWLKQSSTEQQNPKKKCG